MGQDDRLEESLFGGEVTVDRPHTNPGPAGDLVDGDGQALSSEHLLSGLEQFGPVASGVRPERAQEVLQGTEVTVALLSLSWFSRPARKYNPVDKRNDRSVY